jgi:hypothetical protein
MNPAPQPARPKYPPPWRDPVVWSLVLLVTLLFLARIIHWSWF